MRALLLCLALQAQPASPLTTGQGYDALWARGQRVEAIAAMAAALELEGGNDALRLALAERELAIHRPQAALARVASLAGPEADRLKARALCAQGEYERALPFLERSGPPLALLRAQALEALGRLEQCAQALDALLAASASPSVDLLVLQGRRLARAGDPAGAADAFRRALAQDELDREALVGLGQALVAAGRRDEGLKVLAELRRITPLCDQLDFALRAVDLAPNHGPNHAAVGDAERALGRTARAAAAYRTAEALASADELAPIALRHARLIAEDEHDVAAAIALLDGAFESARDPRLAVRAGDLLLADGQAAAARARFEAALALRPGDAQIAQRVASARAQEGK